MAERSKALDSSSSGRKSAWVQTPPLAIDIYYFVEIAFGVVLRCPSASDRRNDCEKKMSKLCRFVHTWLAMTREARREKKRKENDVVIGTQIRFSPIQNMLLRSNFCTLSTRLVHWFQLVSLKVEQ